MYYSDTKDILTEPKEIRQAVRQLIATEYDDEDIVVKTPDVKIIKDVDYDDEFNPHPRYRVYSSIGVWICGNGAHIDELYGDLEITMDGKVVGSFIIGS